MMPNVALDDESRILLEWSQGSRRAFETLVHRYMRDAFMTAYGFVHDVDDARDLSQDAFVRAWKARERFDPSRPFYPWFHRILRNLCINFVQRRRRGESLFRDVAQTAERFTSSGPSPAERLERRERERRVREAIGELSPEHREIIVMKHFRGMSYREIAEALEIPMGTVMSRLYYARRALRDRLEEAPGRAASVPARGRPVGEVGR